MAPPEIKDETQHTESVRKWSPRQHTRHLFEMRGGFEFLVLIHDSIDTKPTGSISHAYRFEITLVTLIGPRLTTT